MFSTLEIFREITAEGACRKWIEPSQGLQHDKVKSWHDLGRTSLVHLLAHMAVHEDSHLAHARDRQLRIVHLAVLSTEIWQPFSQRNVLGR